MQEKDRKFPRVKPEVTLEYQIASDHETSHNASPLDISASGISFCTEDDIGIDSVLRLTIRLDGIDHPIPAIGHVVRTYMEEGKHCLAVEFNSIDYDDFLTVLDYTLAGYGD